MPDLQALPIAAAAVVAFLGGAVWNSVFATVQLRLRGIDPTAAPDQGILIWRLGGELLRCLITAATFAAMLSLVAPPSLPAALGLAALLWFGLQAALLAGAIIWENYDPRLWAIHAGDALLKLLLISTIVTLLS
ncbi:DUF1761 domain-containing protein [Sphingosinicella sp.]|uniref:DUF1761 domain-containing protein n=1 Tax=Sphingosinicella sp. TaxID=1917971 RepID=UPI0040379512